MNDSVLGIRLFSTWISKSITYADPDFFSNVSFSDESYIHLKGYINRQTTLFLGFEWPDVQKPLQSVRVTIWWTVSGHRILGPYFIEDDAQNPLTVNQERYREIIITAPFVRDLKRFCRARNLQLQRHWMQQDGATAHTVGESLACQQQHFGDRLISHGTEFPFPSHSPDLTAPDAERICFLIRWPTWKCSQITGEDTVIFCVHQHVQQSKGLLWKMCEIWIVLIIIECNNYVLSFLSTFVISVTFVLPHTVHDYLNIKYPQLMSNTRSGLGMRCDEAPIL